MVCLKMIRVYARRKADKISTFYKECTLFRIAVRGGAAVATGSLSALLATLILTELTDPAARDSTLTGSFVTKQGEYRCEKLPEGSEVCLNTASVVRYTFNRNVRNIELLSGEASFVVRNERRPFDVLSGGLLVHDLSTSFDVYRKRDSTQVTVIDGRIRIIAPMNQEQRRKFEIAEVNNAWERAPEFHARQQVEFHDETGALRLHPDLSEQRLSDLLAWQKGQIVLDGSTLGEALDEFSRYQRATRFSYSDRSLSGIRLTGTIESTRLDDFLTALEERHIHHTITRSESDTIITLSRQR
jgi:transmembrane sensor